ncbi:universal stress protein [Streptomyces sp. PU-14G]|uniref:universal stress protein n=1 Tax=Streptomyces sp. PU-14G TaxID=2800808 RepID=UPI0034DF8BBD
MGDGCDLSSRAELTRPARGSAGRLVVGVSGSLASLAALRAGAREARAGGRTLVAVLAWEPPEGESAYMLRPDRAWARHWYGEARARLEAAFDEAFGGDPPGVRTVGRRVVRDQPWRALCTVADRADDHLIVGTRAPSRAVFGLGARYGPTTRKVLARAGCPVLTVPAPRFPRHYRTMLRRARADDFRCLPAG